MSLNPVREVALFSASKKHRPESILDQQLHLQESSAPRTTLAPTPRILSLASKKQSVYGFNYGQVMEHVFKERVFKKASPSLSGKKSWEKKGMKKEEKNITKKK
ncbi:hypothetical protein CEXT_38951 [Caerostris extrusa]|uniref:Uncharacterized protein n=1 Tax=Caerostris extrusa TaxID=172846 RepID=A0AAV4P106_CAEEX|nr:hypothetical protein CEXT_38951 [Caerostris extrusa]